MLDIVTLGCQYSCFFSPLVKSSVNWYNFNSLCSWRDAWAGERRRSRQFPSRALPASEFASGEAASEFNSTLHQSSHGWATRFHGFATKSSRTKIPPATQAIISRANSCCCYYKNKFSIITLVKDYVYLTRNLRNNSALFWTHAPANQQTMEQCKVPYEKERNTEIWIRS